MRVLQLCNKPPLPAVDGGCLAMHSITEGLLQAGIEVNILTAETKKHPFLPQYLDPHYLKATAIKAVFIDTDINFFKGISSFFSSTSYHLNRFYSDEFRDALEEILDKEIFDIIQLESLFMTGYIPFIRKRSKAKIVLRAHNVESQLWKRRVEEETDPIRKTLKGQLSRRLAKAEIKAMRQVDGIIPITHEDAMLLRKMMNGRKAPMLVLPFTLSLPELSSAASPQPATVFHIGAMDWEPNVRCIKWFTENCWPLVLHENPGAKLHLAGKKMMPDDAAYAGEGIVVHGQVADARKFISEYAIMAVPLLSGGGMRVKLVEGMAMEKAIVSTIIGAEGTGIENGKHALIADNAIDFANAINRLIGNPQLAEELGKNARKFALQNFELRSATEKLILFYRSL
ncbi:MAG TPA: glycosyltransferase [Bacteroidia bacterium]|nr:glycosyltransferase [Bacteroidia bacterium]